MTGRLIKGDFHAHIVSKAGCSIIQHVLLDGASFTTQSRSTLTRYAK